MKRVLIGLFVAFLLAPLAQYLTHAVQVGEVDEHRAKEPWPGRALLKGPLRDRDYAAKVERHFADHFPLRALFLRIQGQLEYSLFNGARQAVVGEGGWLSDRKILEEHLPQLDRMDDQQLEAGIVQLKKFQWLLQQRGIRFLMVIVPMKATVYPDKFPSKYQRTQPIALERFQGALAANGIEFIDVLDDFRHCDCPPLYYKTDMHWNSVGVERAARMIVDRLGQAYVGHALWNEQMNSTESNFFGDELNSIPLLWPKPERVVAVSTKAPAHSRSEHGEVMTFRSTDPARGVLPPTLIFGNSFLLPYPDVGLHDYFVESSRILDYQQLSRALAHLQPQYKQVILHVYETQLQYHLMPSGSSRAWSGFAEYWDPRVSQAALPPGFAYTPPQGDRVKRAREGSAPSTS